jgi:hypothetical protein
MEKVENLCRTAHVQNTLINTSEQLRSRLRDACANRGRALQDDNIERQHHEQPKRYVSGAGGAARHTAHDPGRVKQADLTTMMPAATTVCH